jgi:nicotinamide-nucleotide amidase
MTRQVNAEIIAIGTEILLGEITDTNSVFIARLLRDIGVNLYFMTSVGDNERRIADAIQIALSRAQVVITCGGLGPTVDDMTRSSVALATDRGLTFHQDLLDKIAERFAGFRAQMTENNRRQAYLPDNAIVIENPVGTAPSFIVEHGEGVVISVPGVPREMKFLMTEKVVPYLRQRFDLKELIKARVLRTAGIGESALDDLIGTELLEGSNPTVGLAAHSGQVDVRITAKAESEAEVDRMIGETERLLRERIDQYVFGVDAETVEMALVADLRSANARVAISETGLEGAIHQPLLKAKGGDLIASAETYAHPDALRKRLGVDPSVPLRELAEQAARAVAESTSAEVGIAIVSLPDVVEDHADSDVGSAVAVYTNGETRSRSYGFGAKSDSALRWTGTWTASTAWRMFKESLNVR